MSYLDVAVLVPLTASMAYPSSINALATGYAPWDDASMLINTTMSKLMPSQDEFSSLHGAEGMHYFFLCYFLVIVLVDYLY